MVVWEEAELEDVALGGVDSGRAEVEISGLDHICLGLGGPGREQWDNSAGEVHSASFLELSNMAQQSGGVKHVREQWTRGASQPWEEQDGPAESLYRCETLASFPPGNNSVYDVWHMLVPHLCVGCTTPADLVRSEVGVRIRVCYIVATITDLTEASTE